MQNIVPTPDHLCRSTELKSNIAGGIAIVASLTQLTALNHAHEVLVNTADERTPSASVPVLQVEALRKEYSDAVALKTATFDVRDGEILALLGPSGSGKTTILRLIAGLDAPTGGRVVLKGRDITALPPQERRIGVMFQSYALFEHMTVLENIMFGLKANKVAPAEREARFKKYMDLVRLPPQLYASRFPSELSGGQQQRVALARALAVEPSILLLDEPFSSLDAQIREEMRVELLSRLREAKITAVLVTHDQVDAAYMADRVVLMNDGKVAQIGSYTELYHNPNDKFVGQFIGESNWVPCSGGSAASGMQHVQVANRRWNCEFAHAFDEADVTNGIVQVRRDAVVEVSFELSEAAQLQSKFNMLTGIAKNISPAGSRSIIWIDLGDESSLQPYYISNSVAQAISSWRQTLSDGREAVVNLALDPALCRYFRRTKVEEGRRP